MLFPPNVSLFLVFVHVYTFLSLHVVFSVILYFGQNLNLHPSFLFSLSLSLFLYLPFSLKENSNVKLGVF